MPLDPGGDLDQESTGCHFGTLEKGKVVVACWTGDPGCCHCDLSLGKTVKTPHCLVRLMGT